MCLATATATATPQTTQKGRESNEILKITLNHWCSDSWTVKHVLTEKNNGNNNSIKTRGWKRVISKFIMRSPIRYFSVFLLCCCSNWRSFDLLFFFFWSFFSHVVDFSLTRKKSTRIINHKAPKAKQNCKTKYIAPMRSQISNAVCMRNIYIGWSSFFTSATQHTFFALCSNLNEHCSQFRDREANEGLNQKSISFSWSKVRSLWRWQWKIISSRSNVSNWCNQWHEIRNFLESRVEKMKASAEVKRVERRWIALNAVQVQKARIYVYQVLMHSTGARSSLAAPSPDWRVNAE